MFFKYLIPHRQNKCVLCFIVTQCNAEEKMPKYYMNLLIICLSLTASLNYAFSFFSYKSI